MADPQDMIIPLPREMRQENATNFEAIDTGLNALELRLKKMDEPLVRFRHALSADSMLGKIVTGEFEERLGALERCLSELETEK